MIFHLFLLALSLCDIEASRSDRIRTIESPRQTNFGDWGNWEYCAENAFAQAVTLKIEGMQGGGDDTGLNGIELTCAFLNGSTAASIRSSEGRWGTQRGINYCIDGLMTGFELRSEPEQSSGDDAGAVDLRLLCSNGQETVAGNILPWGVWTGKQLCPPRSAVCGIRTQVERDQGKGDDTALNNVQMECCKIPHPADVCTVKTGWRTIMACHAGVTDCKISLKSGKATVMEQVASQGWTTTQYQNNGFNMSAEYGLGVLTSRAKMNASAMGTEPTTQKQLSALITENVSQETTSSLSIKCVGLAQELYIVCGPWEISTREYRCVPDKV